MRLQIQAASQSPPSKKGILESRKYCIRHGRVAITLRIAIR